MTRLRTLRRGASAAVLAALAATALAACGQSAQDKAQKQVCDARASIQKQVDSLKSLSLTSASVDQVTQSLQTIQGDLKDIANAQGDLKGDRKQQVQTAMQTFGDSVKTALTDAVKSGSDPKAAVQSAAQTLSSSFKQAMAPIDCSS